MTSREADPLPPTLGDPPGHARNVSPPWGGREPGKAVPAVMFAFLAFPVSVPLLGAALAWSVTRPAVGRVGALGWATRLSWIAAWLALATAPLFASWGAVLAIGAALALFVVHALVHHRYLNPLTRRKTARRRRLAGLLALEIAVLAVIGMVMGAMSLTSVAPTAVAAVGGIATAAGMGLVAAARWLAFSSFWTKTDTELDHALARTRLLGVPGIWAPFGYQWRGAGPMREWRVIADTARVPAALRFEVTIRGTRPARIRKREDGDPAGVRLTDPILASTLVVEGVETERADAMLAEVHEVLLPLIHGRSAILERGVLRVDLYPEPPFDQPWQWMELTLRRMIALSEVIEGNVIGEPPRTDEVLRQLQEMADQLSE